MVGRNILPGATEIHRRIVGIEAEVPLDIVARIGTVERFDRSVEIRVLRVLPLHCILRVLLPLPGGGGFLFYGF